MKIKSVTSKKCGTGEITMGYAEQTFKELLAFQGYGFCFGYDCEVATPDGIKPIGKLRVGDSVLAPGDAKGERWAVVSNVMPQGKKELYLVEFRKTNRAIKCTIDHKFLCNDGTLRPLRDIMGSKWNIMGRNLEENHITDVTYLGEYPVIDITVDTKDHLFYCNGLIASNCKAHATSYAMYSAVQMYLQDRYFIEYMSILLSHIDRGTEKKGVSILNERVAYCIKNGCSIFYPNVNKPTDKWVIEAGGIRASIKNIKGFNDRDVRIITENAPYKDLKDFADKVKFTPNKFDTLIYSNALSDFGDVETIYNWYHNQYLQEKSKPKKQETLSLFDDDEEVGIEELPARKFTKGELKELCLDVNGFYVEENLRNRYAAYYEGGIKYLEAKINKDIEPTRDRNTPICNVDGIKAMAEEKRKGESEKPSDAYILAKVDTCEKQAKSQKFNIVLTDGCDVLPITSFGKPQWMKKGGVYVIPLLITSSGYVNINDRKEHAVLR